LRPGGPSGQPHGRLVAPLNRDQPASVTLCLSRCQGVTDAGQNHHAPRIWRAFSSPRERCAVAVSIAQAPGRVSPQHQTGRLQTPTMPPRARPAPDSLSSQTQRTGRRQAAAETLAKAFRGIADPSSNSGCSRAVQVQCRRHDTVLAKEVPPDGPRHLRWLSGQDRSGGPCNHYRPPASHPGRGRTTPRRPRDLGRCRCLRLPGYRPGGDGGLHHPGL